MAEINRLIQFFYDPKLAFAGFLLISVYVTLLYSSRWWPLGIGIIICISTLAVNTDYFGIWIRPPFPFDRMVLYGRSITFLLLMIAVVILLITIKPPPYPLRVPPAALGLLALQLALCLRQAFGGSYLEAGSRAAVFLMIFFMTAYFLYRRAAVHQTGLRDLCRAIAWGLCLHIVLTILFMLVDFRAGREGNRWFGLTGNPNHAAMVVALLLPAVLGSAVSGFETKKWRIFYLVVTVLCMFPLFLSGSRGGMLTLLVGILVLFRLKIGKLILILIPLSIGTYMVFAWFGDSETSSTLARFTSGATDSSTRIYVWEGMIDDWLSNPFLGKPGAFGVAENSYLGVLQRLGIVGLIMQLGVIALIAREIFTGLTRRSQTNPNGIYFDISISGLSAVAVNSMFEATFFSNLNQTVFVLYIYLVMLFLANLQSGHTSAGIENRVYPQSQGRYS